MARIDQNVTRSPEADQDLVSIWLYGATEWSPHRADNHLLSIEVALDRLKPNPELGRTRNELINGMRSILVDPHVVFYRRVDGNIEVVRVLHQQVDVATAFPGR